MFEFFKKKKAEVVDSIPAASPVVSEKAKGKVFVVERTGGLLPSFFTKKDESKQISEVSTQWLSTNNLVNRPYPPNSFILLKSRCPVLSAAIDSIANDVSSTGWSLSLKEGVKQSSKADAERKELESFLRSPNNTDSLKELISSLITDLETIGDFSLEIARNNGGKIGKIFHIPAHTIFRNKDMNKFAQRRNNKVVWFSPFNSGLVVDNKTGKEKEVSPKAKANELIFKALYNSDGYYGCSPMLPAVGAVRASISVEEFNTYFFDNRGLPEFAVLLTGDWSEGSEQKMSAFMSKELKGNENRGKTLVMVVPDECKAEFKPLEASAKTREGSFRLYAQDLEDRILSVYKCPRSKVGIQRIGKLGGSDTFESLRNYNDSVVEPLQNIIESIFNEKILPGVLGREPVFKFTLNNLHIDDFSEKAEAYTKLLERGAMTPNEVRQKLGIGPEYESGNKYFIASNLIEAGESPTELGKIESDE